MAIGNALGTEVPAGTVLTASHFTPPADSTLWTLRTQQDQRFLQ